MALTVEATEPKAYLELDAGTYDAEITSVELVTDGKFGHQAKFVLTLDHELDNDGNPAAMWAWASLKLNANTKLWRWILAVTGQAPEVSETYDLESLVGTSCRVQVALEKDKNDTERPRVSELLGLAKAKKPTAKPAEKPLAKKLAEVAEDEDPGTCTICGKPVDFYLEDGRGVCERHRP